MRSWRQGGVAQGDTRFYAHLSFPFSAMSLVGRVVQLSPKAIRIAVSGYLPSPKRKAKRVILKYENKYDAHDETESAVLGDIVTIKQVPTRVTDVDTMKYYLAAIVQPARRYTDPATGKLYSCP